MQEEGVRGSGVYGGCGEAACMEGAGKRRGACVAVESSRHLSLSRSRSLILSLTVTLTVTLSDPNRDPNRDPNPHPLTWVAAESSRHLSLSLNPTLTLTLSPAWLRRAASTRRRSNNSSSSPARKRVEGKQTLLAASKWEVSRRPVLLQVSGW